MGKYRHFKSFFIPLALLVLLATSCENSSENNMDYELNLPESLLTEITSIAPNPSDNRVLHSEDTADSPMQGSLVDVIVGDAAFTAVFYDNETAQALINQLPITIDMADLNRNE